MKKSHQYQVRVVWTGNTGSNTAGYTAYERSHTITIEGKAPILGSSDAPFRGNTALHNPEDLLLSSIATCHMLWYLHLCADEGVLVVTYSCEAKGTLVIPKDGPGHFSEAILMPKVTVTDRAMIDKANELHKLAHTKCFIANSVNFPVQCIPVALVQEMGH